MAAGTQYTISLNAGSGFNLDVMYMGVSLGDRAPLFVPSKPPPTQERVAAATPSTIAAGPTLGPTVTVGNFVALARGDFVEAPYDQATQGTQLIPEIVSATQVNVTFANPGGNASKSLTAGNLRVRVRKAAP